MRRVNRFEQKNKATLKERGKSPIDAALHYISSRARTVREAERYLDEQNYGEYEIQQAIERIIELGYLNDKDYAEEFIRTRLNTKPISRSKLYEQLSAHEIPRDIIDDALLYVTDDMEFNNALIVAEKLALQLGESEDFEERLLRRLLGRGFSYEHCREAVRSIREENA